MTFPLNRTLFGVAYYAEYHTTDRLDVDLDLMVEAGITVIRVGESVWSTWEPRNGEFDLAWIVPVLDGAWRRGISVVLGTPTYAVPPWLQAEYPEIAAQLPSGRRVPWGARQEMDQSHAAYLFHAERVIRAILGRHAGHPSIVGFQVDNEPGQWLPHNTATFRRFVRWLREIYGDVETLNREWGLTYWSHRLDGWEELWRPEGNTFPQYDLAWRRFQAAETSRFIAWQADIVREYSRTDQFVTTCLQYPRPGIDDRQLNLALDVVAGNPYYGMQDRLDASVELPAHNFWTTSGVAGLFRQADRMFSGKQAPFIVTETNAQAIGESSLNYPPYPGQLAQSAMTLLSRGATMIEYWHWHTLPYGAETYWGGVLPHSLRPGRVYREVAEIGRTISALDPHLRGYEPDADVALLWSVPSRFSFQSSPSLNVAGAPDDESYERIFDSFHRGVIESGRQARIVHPEQARGIEPADFVRRYPVLVAAALYIAADEDIAFLNAYVAAGGHLILGPRTAYADDEARARVAVAPPGLADVAGVWYEEFSNLEAPIAVTGSSSLPLEPDAAAHLWIDGLIVHDAKVLATFVHPRFGQFPAAVTAERGTGRVTTVGCVPDPSFARSLLTWAAPHRASADLIEAEYPVTVASGRNAAGGRVAFIANWSPDVRSVTLRVDAADPVTGRELAAGTELRLEAWSSPTVVAS